MKVSEFIAQLQKFPADADLLMEGEAGHVEVFSAELSSHFDPPTVVIAPD